MSPKTIIINVVMFFFLFGILTSLIGGELRGIKSSGTVDSAEMSIINGILQNH